MSADQQIESVRRYFAALDNHQLDAVAALFGPDYKLTFDGNPELDTASAIGMFGMFLNAFPNVRHEVRDIFGAGDRVVARIMVHGTHDGDLMGIPATGKPVAFGSINIMRFADGNIAEHWASTDMLGMMQQIGVIPAMGS